MTQIGRRRETRAILAIPAVAAAVLLSGAAVARSPTRPAPPSHQAYVVTDFDSIRLEAPVEVSIQTGRGPSASGEGDRATLDAVDLQMSGRTLVVRVRRTFGLADGPSGTARLALTTGALQRIFLTGAGALTVDHVNAQSVTIALSGSGTLTVPRVETDKATITLIGSGAMTLAGRVADATVTLGGSGRIDATALDVQRLRASADGSGEARLAATETATATSTGAGRLEITGRAKCSATRSGTGALSCGGMRY